VLRIDFDFGVDQMMYLVQQCRFPWLIGNVFDQGRPLGNGLQTYLLTASNGIKIGLMGLVEKCIVPKERSDCREWLDTINSLPPNLEFVTPAEMAKKLVPKLREQGAEIIVALTHMV
jgi:5'-nucleotidase